MFEYIVFIIVVTVIVSLLAIRRKPKFYDFVYVLPTIFVLVLTAHLLTLFVKSYE